MSLKQELLNNIKNIYGWKTKRKIVVISVDDYGSIRLDSKKARESMDKVGLRALAPTFDNLDTLETREDLEILYETLTSVKDKNGNYAIFTPFALPCNVNFEAMAKIDNKKYIYELLPDTYRKLESIDPEAYQGTWKLWKEGINKGLMKPQSHGREHFNLRVFQEKLNKKDFEVLTALKNKSCMRISDSGYDTIHYSAAFDFWDFNENYEFKRIIMDGLNAFEKVFGYRSKNFSSPRSSEHPIIHEFLFDGGIKFIDTPFIKEEHQGKGEYRKKINYTGKRNKFGMIYLVRNVVFEPINDKNFDWVDFSLKQIEAAFRWNRPAIISSHRVNFCGYIDPKNRLKGIEALEKLLKKIVEKWPSVEFMSADELGELIST